MKIDPPVITILCAGPGLGFYVPGILMQRQLYLSGVEAHTEVFEGYLQVDKQDNVAKAKKNFHRNFSFALMGQNLAKDPSPFLDIDTVSCLLDRWAAARRSYFLVFSGFWIPVLEQYRQMNPGFDLQIDLCHVDAANSTSWSLFDTSSEVYVHYWFNNWENQTISFYLNVDSGDPLPYSAREDRYMIHGGGWGMGTYQQKIGALNAAGMSLNIITYEDADLQALNTGNDYYMIDPGWSTWQRNIDGMHDFPPFAAIKNGRPGAYRKQANYPPVYDLIKKSKAIISKPGAGTLIDCLSSATPLIYLEPFGNYEAKNAALWQQYGLAISYETWEASGFNQALLEPIYYRIMEVRSSSQNFVTFYKSHNKWN